MLRSLTIHNYAIIDEIVIDFSPKMNVITGETGAGKSILMGALSLILGDRADTSVLLHRDRKCVVEAVFAVDPSGFLAGLLAENDFEADHELIIRREITAAGKSRAFVNDTPVNLELLRKVCSQLVDLHRQFDTLSLSDANFQRDVLDALAGNQPLLQRYQSAFRSWKAAEQAVEAMREAKRSFEKEYDYHKFLYEELEQACFRENELEEAEEELKMLSHAEEIRNGLGRVAEALSDGEQPLVQQLKSLVHQLESVSRYHAAATEISQRLRSAQIELQDIAGEVDTLNEQVSVDPRRIEYLNERIAAGQKLLRKHGLQTTADLLNLQEQLSEKLQAVMDIDGRITDAEQESARQRRTVDELAAQLSEKRKGQMTFFEKNVNALLARVGMPNARLKVTIERQNPELYGIDNVEFLFDANVPSSRSSGTGRFEPIRKVASGGELSRLMLSIKSLVAESMDLPTLIFDEIDTGISGEAARQVAAIMSVLSAKRQLITITHQPQIAGKADLHLFVYKAMQNDALRTSIRTLSGDERIVAIARMLSGEKPTTAALENAREMMMN